VLSNNAGTGYLLLVAKVFRVLNARSAIADKILRSHSRHSRGQLHSRARRNPWLPSLPYLKYLY
jgi:hypothetical protein